MMRTSLRNRILSLLILSLILVGAVNIVSANAADQKNEKNEPIKYSGMYKGRQVVPNTLAIFCQMEGPVFVGTEKATVGKKEVAGATASWACLLKILEKMKHPDPQTRDEGVRDWKTITQDEIDQFMSETIAKGAVVENYEKDQDTMVYAAKETKDDHTDNVTKAATQLNMADVINTLRGLYAEELKYTVLSTLSSVTYVPQQDNGEEENKK